jgi:hypothetical protein
MSRIDAEAIRETIHRRPCGNGDEVAAFSRAEKRALAWNHGDRGKVKARYAGRVRTAVRVQLSRHTTI